MWGAVLSYIQAKSVWLAGGVALFGVLIMLVSMGAMSPMQMFEYANKAVESKTQASK